MPTVRNACRSVHLWYSNRLHCSAATLPCPKPAGDHLAGRVLASCKLRRCCNVHQPVTLLLVQAMLYSWPWYEQACLTTALEESNKAGNYSIPTSSCKSSTRKTKMDDICVHLGQTQKESKRTKLAPGSSQEYSAYMFSATDSLSIRPAATPRGLAERSTSLRVKLLLNTSLNASAVCMTLRLRLLTLFLPTN